MRKKIIMSRFVIGLLLIVLLLVATVTIKKKYTSMQAKEPRILETYTPLLGSLHSPVATPIYDLYEKENVPKSKNILWEPHEIYVVGDEVKFKNHIFRARWWNQGEIPDSENLKGVWECVTLKTNSQEATIPIEKDIFKVIGYFTESQAEHVEEIPYEKLTHIYYAFAIPKENGMIMPLAHPHIAKKVIQKAKEKGVKVLLSVGGKYYNGAPLEDVFALATSSEERCKRFAANIINIVNQYGFEGVDIDWEYPSIQEDSKRQYAKFIYYLNKGLKKKGKLLSITVSPGVTPYKEVRWDAKGYDDSIFSKVDWVNIPAYGDEERYLTYNYAVEALSYWKKERQLKDNQLVLGVNFYATPHNASYGEIVEIYEDAHKKDRIDNMYYNGIITMQYKTLLALKETRGIVIWELMGDTSIKEKSLLNAIRGIVDNEKNKK